MTRPDFAEMAREWLHRTTSITSASPETERAVAQELERVWQLGGQRRKLPVVRRVAPGMKKKLRDAL